jgi:D-alanyl-lipoteichoic acid acyltransferase DltB (MBOAT superfamily)
MLFNSYHFFVFFPVVVTAFFLLKRNRSRHLLLLGASYYFYMAWIPEYAILLVLSTLVDYTVGILLSHTKAPRARVALLLLSLGVNLGMLAFFKYLFFFTENLNGLLDLFGSTASVPALNLLLPIGISFYTFQTLSYTIDVFRNKIPAERNIVSFALFVSFFPQMVAGPIERASHFLPQLKETHRFESQRVIGGLQRMGWGLWKKMVIADTLAITVNQVFADPASFSGVMLLLALYLFAIQIYCDFSGYSDIAIGAGQVLGFQIAENFRLPYFARSIRDFWRRWHMTLYFWFRDYIYIPLGGSRVSVPRWVFNVLLVFFITGLWHGASWTFIVWGLLHGTYLLTARFTQEWRDRLRSRLALSERFTKVIQVVITFHLVVLSWLPFRASSITDAWSAFVRILTMQPGEQHMSPRIVTLSIGLALFLLAVQVVQRRTVIRDWIARAPWWVSTPSYAIMGALFLLIAQFGAQDFIYFQF